MSHILKIYILNNFYLGVISRIGLRKWLIVHTSQEHAGSHLLKYNQYQIHQDNEWLDRFLQQKNLICWICSLVKIERKKPIPRY